MTIHCRPVHQQFRRSLEGGNGRRRYRAGAQPLGFRRPQGRKAGAPVPDISIPSPLAYYLVYRAESCNLPQVCASREWMRAEWQEGY